MGPNSILKAVIGWVMVVVGLVAIGQSINLSNQYFSGGADFPPVFKTPAVKELNAPAAAGQTQQDAVQAQVQQSVNQAVGNLLPADSIAKMLNILSWSIFATLLVYAGGTITGLGIRFLSSKGS